MFKRKRTKIAEYLRSAPGTAFAQLLSDWYGGTMHSELEALGLAKLDDHIDWLPDYKSISMQARYGKLYVDIQIDQKEFTIAADEDEPDEPSEFPLLSADDFYETVRRYLEKLW